MTRKRAPFLALAFCSAAALSAPSADDVLAHQQATADFTALIETAQQSGQAAALQTPEAMRLVNVISDDARMLKTGTYAPAELGPLLDVCGRANRSTMMLALFDPHAVAQPNTAHPKPAQLQAQMTERMNRNTLLFQDQLKALQPFLVRCMAKVIPPMTEFTQALPAADMTETRSQGLARTRSGLLQVYAGTLLLANDTAYRTDFRLALLAALAENTTDFVSVVPIPKRRQLLDATQAAAAKASAPYKANLTRIAESLDNGVCVGLCAVR